MAFHKTGDVKPLGTVPPSTIQTPSAEDEKRKQASQKK